jgi:hypothetical protein
VRYLIPVSPESWALWFRLLRAPTAWAVGAGLICAVVWIVQSTAWGAGTAGRVVGYHLGDPWSKAIVRLPASVLGRTPGLPAWAAVAQVTAAVLIGVAVLGWRICFAVGMTAHVASSLLVSSMSELDPVHAHWAVMAMGTPDAGPSAFTVAVAACVFVTIKMRALLVGLVVFLAAVGALAPGLDGFEHTTALVIGCAAGVAITVMRGAVDYPVLSRIVARPPGW